MDDVLPNDIEFFMIAMGFYKNEHAAGSKQLPPIAKPVVKDKYLPATGWKPTYDGEEPPF